MKRINLILVFVVFTLNSYSQNIPWKSIKNPVYDRYGFAVKDACMIEKEGTFYIFASFFYYKKDHIVSHVGCITTKDFNTYSEPLFVWDGHEGGWIGMCSPDIKKHGDKYYLTYNSWGDKEGQPNQLFYAVSEDLIHWDKHNPLAANITEDIRAIDAAVAFHDDKCYLIYKEKQKPVIAIADNINSNNWIKLGYLELGWFENAQMIEIDNKWHLMGIIRPPHGPAVATLKSRGKDPEDWMKWNDFRSIHNSLPEFYFSTDERANASSLYDNRKNDGYFYLLGAARTEGDSFGGRGDCRLVLYRSKDLVNWEAPPPKDSLIYMNNN